MFEGAVAPLARRAGAEQFTEAALGDLRRTWMHAFALVASRAHGDGDECRLVPLADCLNGVPEGHPARNVELYSGMWPFIRGGLFEVAMARRIKARHLHN